MKSVAAATKTKSYRAARSDWWEAGYYTKGSCERNRRWAKRVAARASRRAEQAAIEELDISVEEIEEELCEAAQYGFGPYATDD